MLLHLLEQSAEKSNVHTQIVVATTDAAEAQIALEKTQGIVLVMIWLPPLEKDVVPPCVALGQHAMRLNHDSYTLYVVNNTRDLVQAAQLCRRSYAQLLAEDLQVTAIPVISQLLQEFRSTIDPASAIGDDFIMLRTNGCHMRIPKGDIRYIESLEKKLVFYLGAQTLSLYSSITTYEELFKEHFFRCHRSYLVNTSHIQAINLPALTIQLTNGTVIPISRSQRAHAKELLEKLQEGGNHA